MPTAANVKPDLELDSEYTITLENLALYQRNGYVKLKNVLSPAVLDYHGREISAKVKELNNLNIPMAQPFPVIPILGTSDPKHLQDCLASVNVQITAKQANWLRNG